MRESKTKTLQKIAKVRRVNYLRSLAQVAQSIKQQQHIEGAKQQLSSYQLALLEQSLREQTQHKGSELQALSQFNEQLEHATIKQNSALYELTRRLDVQRRKLLSEQKQYERASENCLKQAAGLRHERQKKAEQQLLEMHSNILFTRK